MCTYRCVHIREISWTANDGDAYMFICMFIYICTYTYYRTYIYLNIHVYTCMYMCTYKYVCIGKISWTADDHDAGAEKIAVHSCAAHHD